MARDPVLLRLDGPGPYTTPAVEGFLGLAMPEGRLPVQIRLVLSGGSELLLPIAEPAFDKLIAQFASLHAEKDKS